MKKIIYLLLLIVMSFGLVACGGGDEPPAPETYTITFKQDGFDDVIREVEVGETLATSQIPVIQGSGKTGYTIAWDVTDFTTITDDATVNAVETPNTYRITINNNGGVGGGDVQVTFDAPYTITEPTRAGWTFVKWVKVSGASEEDFTITSTYTIDGNITLKAIWKENTNRIIFKGVSLIDVIDYELAGQLEVVDGVGVALDIKANVLFEAPVPAVSGKFFVAWVDADGKYVELPNYITEDMEVTASFATVPSGKYVVAFIEDGYAPVIKEVNVGATLTDIPAVQTTEAGYEIFWDADFSAITENTVVYTAKTEKTFKIFYRGENESIAHLVEEFGLKFDASLNCYYQEVEYLDSFALVDEIIDNNYKLIGWRNALTGVEFVAGDRYTLTEDVHLSKITELKDSDEITNDPNQWSPAD